MDFKVGPGGDVLDLRDLLQSEHAEAGAGTAAVLNHYLHFSEVRGDVVLSVDHQASGQVAQTITLAHFSLDSLHTALGASSSSDPDLITRMLANGNLQTEA
ncbi:MAG: type I secretion C-terminal target domain-containing protein [Rhodoferax sp.]|nr:type I secretion C-terminal target domain-containing protein [Rhodoferax sp.]